MASKLRRDRPGYQSRKRTDGSVVHYWNPSRACSKAPKGLPVRQIAHDADEDQIAAICQAWTDELLGDLEGMKTGPVFDGTIGSLIRVYRTDPESPFQSLKHTTRIRDYEPTLRMIEKTVGERAVVKLKGDDFRRWYREWAKGDHVRRAHGGIRKLRAILSYGLQQRLHGCKDAREILSLIEFEAPAPRKIKMDYEHALAICDQALKSNRPSIALTQAIQWDTGLRRIHIIGEWLPIKDGEHGGIVRGRTKWQGLTAADIENDVLTVPLTAKNKTATRHDLTACPLVQHVLQHVDLPKVGPLIVSETTSLPYRENYYATDWRAIAESAGVDKNVWSMDSRAGAISEAEAATGSLDAARKLAGHTNARTTQVYVRNDDLENNRRVAAARASLHPAK
ncbi:site-specific integrase [Pararhizobium mangrovi]|uniref:Integrase n=1 Tax=Pararhizobium mangrovi TaxID=2590452 RepID=A0A506TWE9_9HYPH|nr:integrase [Pararhizobium mangrovi]TPW26402.1 integrase [Pararhizobium mangrovi]